MSCYIVFYYGYDYQECAVNGINVTENSAKFVFTVTNFYKLLCSHN